MNKNIGYDTSMLAYLKECREDTGNRDVWSFLGKRMRRDGLYGDIDTLSRFLKSTGVKKGESVAICLPNIPNAIVAVYAANQIGAISNVVHPLVPPEGLKSILKEVGSKVLFIFDLFYEKHKRIIEELGVIAVVCSVKDYAGSIKSALLGVATRSKTKNIKYSPSLIEYKSAMKIGKDAEDIIDGGRGEDIAVYLHSGGTTGSPKTVMLSNRALNALADTTKAILGGEVTEEDSMLMAIPLFHGFGLGVCMHTTLAASGRMVMMPAFNAKSACKLLKKEKISFISGVPTMYEKMMAEKLFDGEHLKYLKQCYCGGDKLPETTKAKFDAILEKAGNPITLSEGYGLTEVVSVCAVNTDSSRARSVGKGLSGVKFKIVSESGEETDNGEVGEILISTQARMSGYLNDPEATAEAMVMDESGEVWIRTGDLGYMDSDGYLYFKDRKKRLVKISGVNVFPKEIEELVEAMPEVRFAAALEVKINQKSAIKLLVVMNKGYNFSPLIEESILRRISQNLMKYSTPRIIEARESLPLTEIGKVDYKKLAIEEEIK